MKKIINILFGMFLLLALYPNIERILYFNEIFVLTGLILLISKHKVYYRKSELVTKCLLFYIYYGFSYAIFSFLFLKVSTTYEYIRTLPVWYSSFTFFLGIEFINNIKLRNWIGGLKSNIALMFITIVAPGRLTNQILLPYSMVNPKIGKYFLIISSVFFLYKGGATSYVSLGLLVALSIFKNRKFIKFITSKYVITALIAIFIYMVREAQQEYGNFLVNSNYAVFKSIADNNTIWRFMFWVYEFKINIFNNPFFGIGFGTPLFDLKTIPAFITADDGTRMTPYTLGTHNSLIFILVRLGIFGLLPILIIFGQLLKEYFTGQNFKLQIITFNMFLFISLAMLFNVIMESPVYGGIFWITTGMFYQTLRIKKLKKYEQTKNTVFTTHATSNSWS